MTVLDKKVHDDTALSELSEKNEGSRLVLYGFIEGYGFAEGADYTSYQKVHPLNNQEITDHALTIDMVKEVSMIQRNDRAKQTSRYFVEWLQYKGIVVVIFCLLSFFWYNLCN